VYYGKLIELKEEIVVIGAGVIGLSCAYELTQLGAKVTVLERGDAGAESSWAGGGILFPLLPWDYGKPVTALTELSRQRYPGWIDKLRLQSGIDPEYLVSGMRVLPPYDIATALAWCGAHGLHAENDDDVLFLPDVAQVRNPRLIKALRRSLELMGVGIVEHVEVSGFRFDRGRVAGVETNRGDYAADNYIVAAGAWSGTLLGDLVPKTPIWPVRGQMLLFKAEAGLLPHILLQDGIYLIPRLDGQILVGSTLEDVGFDKSITEDAQVSLLSKAVAMFPPLGQASLIQHWAGLRPGSPDNVPVIGRHPEIENLYLNAGHFRYGVTMAPASAILLANMIAGKAQPIDVAPYAWR
jgi:glycine oxidase